MSQNKVTFGLRNVHIAFVDETSPTQPNWKTPAKVPGAVRWTPEAQGEQSPFYADDTTYYIVDSNNGYTSELELANIADAIQKEMLGWEIDSNGMLIETADATPKKFAIMFEVQGDKRGRRFVYYDCQASRPSKERTTKADTIEPTTDVLSVTISPIEIDGKMVVKGEIELNDTNTAAYNAFFSAVTKPTSGVVDKTKLAATIALANTLEEELYTVDSWTALETALTAATAVNSNSSAVQAQVDSANATLQAAINSLVVL